MSSNHTSKSNSKENHASHENEPLLASEPTNYNSTTVNHILTDVNISSTCSTNVVYHRRWFILFLFCALCFTQNLIWNTWGPLTNSVKVAFGWSLAVVALQTNWGCITYIISTVYFCWLIDVKGLRVACLITAFLMTAGAGLRCITSDPNIATWLIHGGQILNGFAGPVPMAAAPALSAVWFPAHQRTTSTAICSLSGGFGMAASFIIGPLLVPKIDNHNSSSNGSQSNYLCLCDEITNTTDFSMYKQRHELQNACCSQLENLRQNDTDSFGELETRKNIMRLMYIECVLSGIILLSIFIYFPNKPPIAPSITATRLRINFTSGLKDLFRHAGFWKIGLCYAISVGIVDCWSAVLYANTERLKVDEVEAGWIGFYGSIASSIVGCIVSRFADVFSRHTKLLLILMYNVSLVAGIVFTLECITIIPFYTSILYTSFILVSVGIEGTPPLYYELVCEATYPIAEGVTNGLLTWLNNVVGLFFLLIMMIPSIDTSWMNWTMVGSIAICLPALCLYKESYKRLDIDDTITVSINTDQRNQHDDTTSSNLTVNIAE